MKKIIADSGCDLRTLQFNDENISYEQVAFKINVGNRVYVDKMAALINSAYPEVQPEIVEMSGLCSYYSSITGLMVGFEHE